MALGFLCLGGGARTFARSNEAVAALLAAMYPALPSSSADNRSHLQVLAVPAVTRVHLHSKRKWSKHCAVSMHATCWTAQHHVP